MFKPERFWHFSLNCSLFTGDPELRILGLGKDDERSTLFGGIARQGGADGLDHENEYTSRSAALLSISQKVACSRDRLRIWVKQHETDIGNRDGLTTTERDRIKELERENR